jgi:hypothetical protein
MGCTHIHLEPSVGLVGSVLYHQRLLTTDGYRERLESRRTAPRRTHHIHGHFVRHDPEPPLQIDPLDLLPYPLHHPLHHVPHLTPSDRPRAPHALLPAQSGGRGRRRTVHKRHLQIHLRELGLTIFPPVFVPETPRYLVVSRNGPGGDQKLFWLLRRLWEGVECRRARGCGVASGDEELAGAFRRRVEQDRGFDLGESYDSRSEPFRRFSADRIVRKLEQLEPLTLVMKVIADGMRDFAPDLEVLSQVGPAEVEVAMLRPEVFVGLW